MVYSILFIYSRLDRQNEAILNATRTVAETEEVGIEITNELARNREKIETGRSRVSFVYFVYIYILLSCNIEVFISLFHLFISLYL